MSSEAGAHPLHPATRSPSRHLVPCHLPCCHCLAAAHGAGAGSIKSIASWLELADSAPRSSAVTAMNHANGRR